jgi:uncharacterized protein (TIGR02246 family)
MFGLLVEGGFMLKRFLVSGLAALGCIGTVGAQTKTKPDPAPLQSPALNKEILARLDDYFTAVNAKAAERFMGFFTPGEDLTVIEDKDLRLSRQEFRAFVDGFFKEVSEIQAVWEKRTVHPLAPGVAVVTGSFKVTGKDSKGAPMAFRSAFTFVLLKHQDEWRVKHVHESSLDL